MTPVKYVIYQLVAVSVLFMAITVIYSLIYRPIVWNWVSTAIIVGDIAGLIIVSAYHLYHGVKF